MRIDPPESAWLLIPDLICVVVCVVAAVQDLRESRISNRLTIPAALAGLAINTLIFALLGGSLRAAGVGLLAALAGGLVCLLVFGLLGAIHFLGFGDVKLMAAVGCLLRWPLAVPALLDVAVAGGVVAVGHAVLRARVGRVLGNLLRLGRRALGRDRSAPVELHRIPYALAIGLGTVWAVLARYLPAVRWP